MSTRQSNQTITDRQTGRQTDRQADRQTDHIILDPLLADRQTNKHTQLASFASVSTKAEVERK